MLYASAIDGPDSSGSWDVSGPGDEGAVGRAVGRDARFGHGDGRLLGRRGLARLFDRRHGHGRAFSRRDGGRGRGGGRGRVRRGKGGGGGADVAALVAGPPEDAEGGWGGRLQEARPNVRKRATRRATVLFKKIPANLTILPNSIRQRSGKRKRNFSV